MLGYETISLTLETPSNLITSTTEEGGTRGSVTYLKNVILKQGVYGKPKGDRGSDPSFLYRIETQSEGMRKILLEPNAKGLAFNTILATLRSKSNLEKTASQESNI